MNYYQPRSLKDAMGLIETGAIPLAGGTILTPEILHFKIHPEQIADLRYLNDLKEIKIENDYLEIGALTTIEQIANSPLLGSGEFKALKQAALSIGNPHVRRVGTVGGNLLWNHPGSDLRPVFFCFDGEVLLSAHDDQNKWIPVKELMASQTNSPHLITKLRVPVQAKRKSGFKKFAWRKSSGKTIVSIAVTTIFNEGTFANTNIFMGGINNTPIHLVELGTLFSDNLNNSKKFVYDDSLSHLISGKDSIPMSTYKIKLAFHGIQDVLNEILYEQFNEPRRP